MSNSDLNIERINELAKKKKEVGLTQEEAKEQTALRKAYLESFRKGFKQQIENTKVIDPEGNDVTHNVFDKIEEGKIHKMFNEKDQLAVDT
ncbi:DUF896 domain-containing protein, partial [Staphylococcus aureus]|uniref:DUF896 domain-containing protein n=1 Tax=Staphylococcus aureus TaxID=1280 RepID=UPI000990A28F